MGSKRATQREVREAITLGRQGRLVIPARVRRALHLEEGDRLTLRVEEKRMVLVPQRAEVERLRGMFRDPLDQRSVVAELIAQRREEARREDREDRV